VLIGHIGGMSNRELVLELVSKLPENTPLREIARKIELIAGIQVAREEASQGLGVSARDARSMVSACAAR